MANAKVGGGNIKNLIPDVSQHGVREIPNSVRNLFNLEMVERVFANTSISCSKLTTECVNMFTQLFGLNTNGLVPGPTQDDIDNGRILYADGTWQTVSQTMVFGAASAPLLNPGFLPPGLQNNIAPSTIVNVVAAINMSLSSIYVIHNSLGTGTGSYTYTLYLNNNPTGLEVTIDVVDTTANGTVAPPVDIVPGDLLAIEASPNGTIATSPSDILASVG